MKKVAATRGHSVRRTNFFRLGTTARGWGFSFCWRGALAVANVDVFLLKRLTLSYSAAAGSARAFRFSLDSGNHAGGSSQCRDYGNFPAMQENCRNFSQSFVKDNATEVMFVKPEKSGIRLGVRAFQFPPFRYPI